MLSIRSSKGYDKATPVTVYACESFEISLECRNFVVLETARLFGDGQGRRFEDELSVLARDLCVRVELHDLLEGPDRLGLELTSELVLRPELQVEQVPGNLDF